VEIQLHSPHAFMLFNGKVYFPGSSSCVYSAWCLSPNCNMNVVPYIGAYSHNITVNMCRRKLKLCVKRFSSLMGGLHEFCGQRKTKREGKYVCVVVQRLQGVAILYFARYTCDGMHFIHFDNVRKHINLIEPTGKI
jgi:hypothetical protein